MRLLAQGTVLFALVLTAVGCGAAMPHDNTVAFGGSVAESVVNRARFAQPVETATERRAVTFASAPNIETRSFRATLNDGR